MAAPNNVDDTGRVIKLPTRSPPFDPPMHVILPRFTHCIGGYLLDQRPSIGRFTNPFFGGQSLASPYKAQKSSTPVELQAPDRVYKYIRISMFDLSTFFVLVFGAMSEETLPW